MKIAYVSYEHPLGIAGGGIGTYIGQIASLMASRGHEVEVFSGHLSYTGSSTVNGYQLHLIQSADTATFRTLVFKKFAERQKITAFEIVESPEYGADALLIKKGFSDLPLALKLHTPTFLVSILNNDRQTFLNKLRFMIGGLLKGEIAKRYWIYNKENDPEYHLFELANSVCSPSNSLKKIVNQNWGDKSISIIPNLFIPSFDFTPKRRENKKVFTVTFIGKLEKRKGILDLMDAIPMILKEDVDVKFMFVGIPLASPIKGLNMEQYIGEKLKAFANHIEFKGFVPNQELGGIFSQTDICVFPSLWENFPTVCLESMSAGVPVIGTNNGGMADMMEHKKTGILIPPNAPKEIAKSVLLLKHDEQLREQIALNGHQHILKNYNGEVMGKVIEDFYQKTINTI